MTYPMQPEFDRLMVWVPDRLSELIAKGEITERYYNPGNLFREVHLVMTNNDAPDPAALRGVVGDARLVLHNIPADKWLFARTLGWRPWLLGTWVKQAIALANQIQPQLMRCHGVRLNAFAAAHIKQELGIPYVVSVHCNPDDDVQIRTASLARRLAAKAMEDVALIGLKGATWVLPVYRSITPYLERRKINRFQICYNVINPLHLKKKSQYELSHPVRVVSVSRQIIGKNPCHLLLAAVSLPNVELTLVGDGPLHQHLRQLAQECGAKNRIHFIKSINNDELCRSLPDYDLFAVHSDLYAELSKAMLEAFLSGLPVIINHRKGVPVPELSDQFCLRVPDSVEGYRNGLIQLIEDHAKREALGRAAYAHAKAYWSPATTEAKFATLYREVLEAGSL